jgi:hypothetical protein
MAIHIKCPKGHPLTAKESSAGKTGKCPICKCAVAIPKQGPLTESAILDILGDPDPTTSVFAMTESLFAVESQENPPSSADLLSPTPATASSASPSTRTCTNCERDIDSRYHICPHCKTYLVDKL